MTEETIETGDVTFTITDTNGTIKNATVIIESQNEAFNGFTDKDGEITFNEVPYDTYDVTVKHTGYEVEESTLTVDDDTITATITLTHLPTDPDFMEVDLDHHLLFQVSEHTSNPDYRFATSVSEWIHDNLEALTDDNDVPIFNKISYGYDEQKLKTFGKKPTADIYIDHVEYGGTLDNPAPESVHTIIIFYMKGANDVAYLKTTELHDLLMQKFLTDEDWKILTGVVRDTVITDSQLMSQPGNKKWGCMGAFQLTHYLYI